MLGGWNFTLNTGATQTTDATGCTVFDSLRPADYTVTEEMKPGWTNITPLSQNITVLPATQATLTFVNEHLVGVSSLNVCKQDTNGTMLSGWSFALNTGPVQTTDGTGCTVFDGLEPIEYTVTENLKPGWVNITPLSQSITLSPAAQGTLTFINELVGPEPVPEFPSVFLSLTFIIGFLGVVMMMQRNREH
jgi:uncharacterized surface anchored protein